VHELKTPLTPVLASSELLVSELHEEPWLSVARNIYRGAVNLNRRIDELLDLARVEIGILQVNFRRVDPQTMLQGIAGEMSAMLSTNGQTLALGLDASLPPMWADEERLRQVLLNLLVNASKFSPEGARIALRAAAQGKFLVIEVEDNGPGIPSEVRSRIFERGFTTKTAKSGMGLGLWICRTIVEDHHGSIEVTSEPGKGTTFTILLPVTTDSERKADE